PRAQRGQRAPRPLVWRKEPTILQRQPCTICPPQMMKRHPIADRHRRRGSRPSIRTGSTEAGRLAVAQYSILVNSLLTTSAPRPSVDAGVVISAGRPGRRALEYVASGAKILFRGRADAALLQGNPRTDRLTVLSYRGVDEIGEACSQSGPDTP